MGTEQRQETAPNRDLQTQVHPSLDAVLIKNHSYIWEGYREETEFGCVKWFQVCFLRPGRAAQGISRLGPAGHAADVTGFKTQTRSSEHKPYLRTTTAWAHHPGGADGLQAELSCQFPTWVRSNFVLDMLDSHEKENGQSVQNCLPSIFVLKRKSKDKSALESGMMRKSESWQVAGDEVGLRVTG